MKALSVTETKNSEKQAIENGLNENILMEAAAAALFENIIQKTDKTHLIALFCGGGKNGADGLSTARKLSLYGYKVTVFLVGEAESEFCKSRLNACAYTGVKVIKVKDILDVDLSEAYFIVDAVLGVGLNRNISGIILETVKLINASPLFTLSVDIPTGLNADSGRAMTDAVVADETLTFTSPKLGHILEDGRHYTGNLIVADIGVKTCGGLSVVNGLDIRLPLRKVTSHKGNYGRVCVIGGSAEMPGGILLSYESAAAALKCGTGYATLCVPASLKSAYQARVREETLRFIPDREGKLLFDTASLDQIAAEADSIAIGMGLGKNPETVKIIEYLCKVFSGTLIVDADGLNSLEDCIEILEGHKCKLILTPHVGEFRRLIGESTDAEFSAFKVEELAKSLNAVVLRKSATSIISDGHQTYLNTTGTPAMAKAGSGDVLSGMVAAFACRLSPLEAAVTAAYHFGRCGEEAENLYGSESVTASRMIIKS